VSPLSHIHLYKLTSIRVFYTYIYAQNTCKKSIVAPMNADRDDDQGENYHNSEVLFYTSLAAAVATVLTIPGFGFHMLRRQVFMCSSTHCHEERFFNFIFSFPLHILCGLCFFTGIHFSSISKLQALILILIFF
jgi:hypothetical protein